jgi:hypothetical protein
MSELHRAFRQGAEILAGTNYEYTSLHRGSGITPQDWELFTQAEFWTTEQSTKIRGILGQCVEACMTISGMPATPLPGQYVAAVIAILVSPPNRMVACTKAPETFDAYNASGLEVPFEIVEMKREQLMALVMAYSGGYAGEPVAGRLPKEVTALRKKKVEKDG